MRILVTDDEELVLEETLEVLQKLFPEAEILSASDYKTAISMTGKAIDIAFLDIEMPYKNGIELAKELQNLYPRINIIFLTAYPQYAMDAYRLLASDYLIKPLREEDVRKTMRGLRYDIVNEGEISNKDKINASCFGNFNVFNGNGLITFRREKVKELLAFLIAGNGETYTSLQIMDALWEESADSKRDYFWKILSELRKELKSKGLENLLIDEKDAYSVDIKYVNCDYYDYLNNNNVRWNGRFMEQYSGWAEEIKAALHFKR